MPRYITLTDWDFLQEWRVLHDDIEQINKIIREKTSFLQRNKSDIEPLESALLVSAIKDLSRARRQLELVLENWSET